MPWSKTHCHAQLHLGLLEKGCAIKGLAVCNKGDVIVFGQPTVLPYFVFNLWYELKLQAYRVLGFLGFFQFTFNLVKKKFYF